MLTCLHCQHPNAEANRFCESCGEAMREIVCASCSSKVQSAARFCWYCGAALTAATGSAAIDPQADTRQNGERKQVSVLFADIRGATHLIQGLDPEAAMQQLDPVLLLMSTAVTKYGGVVNSVQGDGIMALFGAPVACEDHAVRACLAACDIHEQIRISPDIHVQIRVGQAF